MTKVTIRENAFPDSMFVISKQYSSGHQKPVIFDNEVLDITDPKIISPYFSEAKKKEL